MVEGLFKLKTNRAKNPLMKKKKAKKDDDRPDEERLAEFMFVRMAKGKKNEIFDLLYRSKWTKETRNEDIEENTIQFNYKQAKTLI